MIRNESNLILDLNDEFFIFTVFSSNQDKKLEIIKKKIIKSSGIKNGKIIKYTKLSPEKLTHLYIVKSDEITFPRAFLSD